ncbi:MAG: LacI family transcriptional regulator, partial [Chloroflexota bacterium]
MPATIKDIAKRAGVTHSTVSRALHGSPLISQETADRIRKAALELGYQPSAAARSLKTNSTRVLGVVLSSIDDPFFSEILQGIEETAQTAGYSLFIGASQRDPQREQKIVQAMVEHRVDGIIICSTSFGEQQGRQLSKYNRPIVAVNSQSVEDYRYSIFHDDVDGSRQITRHLIDLGHQRIAFIGNSLSGRTTLDRQAGFQQEMEAARLPILPGFIHQEPGGVPENGVAALDYYLSLPSRPTAVFCFNDMVATGLLHGLQNAGLKTPGDVSVAGFDNIKFSAYTNPPLTTFDQPKRFLGTEAARLVLDLLLKSLEDVDDQPKIRVLKGKLLVRQSTAPPAFL